MGKEKQVSILYELLKEAFEAGKELGAFSVSGLPDKYRPKEFKEWYESLKFKNPTL